jgi:hypothetical protein
MSASNEWTQWHLTPRGWEAGAEKTDFNRTDRDPPADRVLTVTYKEHVSSSFSAMDATVREEWRSPDAALVAALLNQFGPAPEHL